MKIFSNAQKNYQRHFALIFSDTLLKKLKDENPFDCPHRRENGF